MNLALIMLITYLGITIGISFIYLKKNKDAKQFSLANGGLSTTFIITLLFSEMIAGSGTIGNASAAFERGISSVWANWGMSLGCILFVILAGKFYRAMGTKYNIMSVPEAYEKLFDFRCRMVLLVVVVVVYGILYSTQAVAAASIMSPLLGIEKTKMTMIITAIFVLVTVTGGMKGIASMNIVHAIVIYFGLFFVVFTAIKSIGGLKILTESLPSSYFSLGQPSWSTTLASALGTSLSYLAAATTVSAVLTAKSRKVANRGMIIAAILIISFALAPALIGMCAKIVMPEINPNNSIFLMASSLGEVYGGIVSMAIIAAIYSTGPALLLIVSTTIARDFYKGIINKNATDAQELKCTRITAVILGYGGSLFGLNTSSILNQMLGAFQIRSIVGIVLVVALLWPRVTSKAAFWSMLVGGLTAAFWFFLSNPLGISPLWPAGAITLLILIPMTLMSKEKVSPEHKRYEEALKYNEYIENKEYGTDNSDNEDINMPFLNIKKAVEVEE